MYTKTPTRFPLSSLSSLPKLYPQRLCGDECSTNHRAAFYISNIVTTYFMIRYSSYHAICKNPWGNITMICRLIFNMERTFPELRFVCFMIISYRIGGVIRVMSTARHYVPYHRQLKCFFNNLSMLWAMENIRTSHYGHTSPHIFADFIKNHILLSQFWPISLYLSLKRWS